MFAAAAAVSGSRHERAPPSRDVPDTSQGPDFARLVGHDGWWRLAPDIRARFTEHPAADRPIAYTGTMHTVHCSAAGWLLAQACRLIGTPFALHTGRDVTVDINLHDAPGHAIVWERVYHFPGRAPVRVSSTKGLGADGGLTESIRCGIGMRLAVFEAAGAMHFLSLGYFLRLRGRCFALPRALTPGSTHVLHADLGGGRFRFAMTIHHPLLGTLFRQDGTFQRAPAEDAS